MRNMGPTGRRKTVKFLFTNDTGPKPIDDQITRVFNEMSKVQVSSDGYRNLSQLLERLTKIKAMERKIPVSRDLLISIAGNMLMTATLLLYENRHVITSRNAFAQIGRGIKAS
jgi:hypothetical protein